MEAATKEAVTASGSPFRGLGGLLNQRAIIVRVIAFLRFIEVGIAGTYFLLIGLLRANVYLALVALVARSYRAEEKKYGEVFQSGSFITSNYYLM